MKKINSLELSSIILMQTITLYSGISIYLLIKNTGVNSWIAVILSYVFGMLLIIALLYISNYKKELDLPNKINNLFEKKISFIINLLISLVFLIICITALYNINCFITSQFLYRTPILTSSLLYIILVTYNASKGINTISKLSFILTVFNIILLIISITSLISNFQLDNLLPLLKENTEEIIPTALKISSINIVPLLSILIIPKDKFTNPNKYNKTIIVSYILGGIISLLIIAFTIGVLGIYLSKIFEYPEYIVLKKVHLFSFIERIENIVYNQWITGNFIYISLLLFYISKSFTKIKKNNNILIISSVIVLILTNTLFKNITMFNNYLSSIFPYIIASLLIIYFIIIIRIIIKKRQKYDII